MFHIFCYKCIIYLKLIHLKLIHLKILYTHLDKSVIISHTNFISSATWRYFRHKIFGCFTNTLRMKNKTKSILLSSQCDLINNSFT